MATKIQELSTEYTSELIYVGLNNPKFFEILFNYLEFSFLPFEHEKKIWKECVQFFRENFKPPTIGYLSKQLLKDKSCRDYLTDIKNLDLEQKQIDSIIDQFENFIKESKFVKFFEDSADAYNKGDHKKAFEIYFNGAKSIEDFSIKDKMFERVFSNFNQRNIERKFQDVLDDKVPFGIDEIDDYCYGGPQLTDTYLVMAESGIGKSQFLIHHAVNTARLGFDAAIFQIEGTKKQVMDRVDSNWSGVLYHEMKYGSIDDERYQKLQRVISKIRGEIFIESFERFGGVTFNEIRKSARELKKRNPNLRLILIDYLELMEVGDNITYGPSFERHRQQKLGKLMKELAMELKCVVGSVTQASNLSSELKKDPTFVMTREFLSEDKGKIRPFDFFFTLNQTYDEKKYVPDGSKKSFSIIRIFLDKMREYESGQVVKVVNNFRRSRFYERKLTMQYLVDSYDEE